MTSVIEMTTLIGFVMPGGAEWIILLVLGLLIFGRRLPEVGRSLGFRSSWLFDDCLTDEERCEVGSGALIQFY